MRDVSASGARIHVREAIELPGEFILALNKTGTVRRRCRVMWRAKKDIGVRFID
jgi:hypothetical protein